MFRFFKSLFGDTTSEEAVPKSSNHEAAEVENGSSIPNCDSTALASTALPGQAVPDAGPCVEIPLLPIVERLSPALRAKVSRPPDRGDVMKLPVSVAVEQLARGSVRVSYRELRQGASRSIFAGDPGLDETLVELPLKEVLSRLKPNLLARRPDQKQIASPEQIGAVFSARQLDAPAAGKAALSAGHDDAVSSRVMAASLQSHSTPQIPVKPAASTTTKASNPLTPGVPLPAKPSTKSAAPAGSADLSKNAPVTIGDSIDVPFKSIATHWPEPMHRLVTSAHQNDTLKIPFSEMEAALKRGKAQFTWQQLRSWVAPKPITAFPEQDKVTLELPLAVLAPLFMARHAGTAASPRIEPREEIPDIFPSRKATETAATTAAPTISIRLDPAVEAKKPVTSAGTPIPANRLPGTAEMARVTVPSASRALPTEVVKRACQLSGVAGALLATPDGLIIASHLPSGVNAETVAGFTPRVFNRLGEYAQELKFGDPSEFEMSAGKTPIIVFKLSSAYFTVLGKAAEPLPKTQLSVLAGQLSNQVQLH